MRRLGTSAFRSEERLLAAFYSADGKSVIGCAQDFITVWDAGTGKKRIRFPIAAGAPSDADFPRRFAHAAARNAVTCTGFTAVGTVLRHWNLATGERLFERAIDPGWAMEWTPDGSRLVVGHRDEFSTGLTVLDTGGKIVRELAFGDTVKDGYRPAFKILDECSVLLNRSEPAKPAVRMDLESGEILKVYQVREPWRCADRLGCSPDGRRIAISDGSRLTVFDRADAREIASCAANPDARVIMACTVSSADHAEGPILVSPDARRVYSAGRTFGCEAAGGKLQLEVRRDSESTGQVCALTSDGRRSLAINGRRLEQFATGDGSKLADPPGHLDRPRTLWSPDSRTILARAAGEATWTAWNTATGTRRTFDSEPYPPLGRTPPIQDLTRPAVLSADGRRITDFSTVAGEFSGTVWQVSSGRFRRHLFGEAGAARSTPFACRPERERLLSRNEFLDDSDASVRSLAFTWCSLATLFPEESFLIPVKDNCCAISFGRFIAVQPCEIREGDIGDISFSTVRLFRETDGKAYRRLVHDDIQPEALDIDLKGDLVLNRAKSLRPRFSGVEDREPVPSAPQVFTLWDLAAEAPIARWEAPGLDLAAAIAPGGRHVVHAVDRDHFAVFEPFVARKEIATFKLPAKIEAFSFSPDGSRLAVTLADTTMVIYDSSAWEADVRRALTERKPKDLKPLWEALAGPPAKAYEAAALLSLAGDETVDLLRGKISPSSKADAAAIERLIADLDAPRYITRERATRQLHHLGLQAATALRKRAEANAPPEGKGRADTLLTLIDEQRYDAGTLRGLRAVRVLEWIGTPRRPATLGRVEADR